MISPYGIADFQLPIADFVKPPLHTFSDEQVIPHFQSAIGNWQSAMTCRSLMVFV